MDNEDLVLVDGEITEGDAEMVQLTLGLEGFRRMPGELICRMSGDVIEPGGMYMVNARRLPANAPEFLVYNRLVKVLRKSPESRITISYASRASFNQYKNSYITDMGPPRMTKHNAFPIYDSRYEMEGTVAEMFLQKQNGPLNSKYWSHTTSFYFRGNPN